jgi:predicted RNase H-like HicB family nuclease
MTFVDLFVTGCATTPALHVIGVYEAQTPPGIDDRPWWAKCVDDEKSKKSGAVRTPLSIESSIECHQKHARKHAEGEIVISVSDDSRPIVLALTAYDRTHWRVSLKEGARLTKVILAGYHSQRVPRSRENSNGFGAYVPDLPGCVATAASRVEVVALIRDAIEFHIEGLRRAGDHVPEPASQGEVFDVQAA